VRIRSKVLLLLIFGTIIPLTIGFYFAGQILRSGLAADVEKQVLRDARQVAGRVEDRARWLVESTTMVVNALPFENFAVEDLPRTLLIPWRQLSFTTMVALLDAEGRAVVEPFVPDAEDALAAQRDVVTGAEVQRFAGSVPMEAALEASVAVGPVYLSDTGSPRVVVASAVKPPHGVGEERWVLAIGVSLQSICDVARNEGKDGRKGALLDSDGRSICGSTDGTLKTDSNYRLIAGLKDDSVGSVRLGQSDFFTVRSTVPLTDWRYFLRVNRDAVFGQIYRLQWILIAWMLVCFAAAVVGAVLLSRGITRPLETLTEAAARVAGGDYSRPIDVNTRDEVGRLSTSFNRMMEEIRAWNAELNERVNEKTRELAKAQEQIIATQKMAALGELGAGVAHEINNPLTGVIGNAQLLLADMEYDAANREIALEIVRNSRRVAEVVDALLRFSQHQWGESMKPVVLEKIVVNSVDMYLERLKEKEIEVFWKARENVQVLGIERDLQIVCSSLLDNALRAVKPGGRIGFDVRRVDGGAVVLGVEDNGCGMSDEVRLRAVDPFFTTAPTDSGSRGVGLTTVARIVEEHEGRLDISSKEGAGTSVKIFFPGKVDVSKA